MDLVDITIAGPDRTLDPMTRLTRFPSAFLAAALALTASGSAIAQIPTVTIQSSEAAPSTPSKLWLTTTKAPVDGASLNRGLIVTYVSVHDDTGYWSNFAKGVLPTTTYDEDPAVWAADLSNRLATPGTFALAAYDTSVNATIPAAVIASAISEINNVSSTAQTNYAQTLGGNWPLTGWGTVGATPASQTSSMGWLQGAETAQGGNNLFLTEDIVRHTLAHQYHANTGYVMEPMSGEINKMVEMIKQGLANFSLNCCLVELQTPPANSGGQTYNVSISKSKSVLLAMSTEINPDFYFRVPGLRTGTNIPAWWYIGPFAEEVWIEAADPVSVNETYWVVVPQNTGIYTLVQATPTGHTPRGLKFTLPFAAVTEMYALADGDLNFLDVATPAGRELAFGVVINLPTPW